jgi:hypothetical protein
MPFPFIRARTDHPAMTTELPNPARMHRTSTWLIMLLLSAGTPALAAHAPSGPHRAYREGPVPAARVPAAGASAGKPAGEAAGGVGRVLPLNSPTPAPPAGGSPGAPAAAPRTGASGLSPEERRRLREQIRAQQQGGRTGAPAAR